MLTCFERLFNIVEKVKTSVRYVLNFQLNLNLK